MFEIFFCRIHPMRYPAKECQKRFWSNVRNFIGAVQANNVRDINGILVVDKEEVLGTYNMRANDIDTSRLDESADAELLDELSIIDSNTRVQCLAHTFID